MKHNFRFVLVLQVERLPSLVHEKIMFVQFSFFFQISIKFEKLYQHFKQNNIYRYKNQSSINSGHKTLI